MHDSHEQTSACRDACPTGQHAQSELTTTAIANRIEEAITYIRETVEDPNADHQAALENLDTRLSRLANKLRRAERERASEVRPEGEPAPQLASALRVFTLNAEIRDWLKANDPLALRQAVLALTAWERTHPTGEIRPEDRNADGTYDVREQLTGQLLGHIVGTANGWEALDVDARPLGVFGNDQAAAQRAVEQTAMPQPAVPPERHGRCPSCQQGVHEYPMGWAHVNLPPIGCVGGLVIIPEQDVRPGDDVVPGRVRGEVCIRYY
jgi:hypothetical protein